MDIWGQLWWQEGCEDFDVDVMRRWGLPCHLLAQNAYCDKIHKIQEEDG